MNETKRLSSREGGGASCIRANSGLFIHSEMLCWMHAPSRARLDWGAPSRNPEGCAIKWAFNQDLSSELRSSLKKRVQVFNEDLFEIFVEICPKVVVFHEDLLEIFNVDIFYQTALSLDCREAATREIRSTTHRVAAADYALSTLIWLFHRYPPDPAW